MARTPQRLRRTRGSIDELPSGSLRVRVYAGIDPVSKRRHYLTEIVPAGPKAEHVAQQTVTRLLNEVNEQRQPRTSATVAQLMELHLERLATSGKAGPKTMTGYRASVALHINPLLGHEKVGKVDAYMLDSFYAELARCRDHCDRRRRQQIHHRTGREHRCDEHDGPPCSPPDPDCRACRRRCRPHQCRPLEDATIRKVHFLLSGAFKTAVRWRWRATNPIAQAEPPSPTPSKPDPPSAPEAARIATAAFEDGRGHPDPEFGTLVWLAMTTGTRRGELCALRWRHVDLDRGVLAVRQAVAQDEDGRWYVKDTKTHQHRRIALDATSLELLRDLRGHVDTIAAALDITLTDDAFLFSQDPDRASFLIPASVTQRYRRLVERLGIDTHLHALRHYSATELLTAGVDVRTVAGRLGHAGGGTTTLRTYTAWLEEADQRAAATLTPRMPDRPTTPLSPTDRAKTAPRSPYEKIAADLRTQILDGTIPPGTQLPTVEDIAAAAGRSVGTAHRALVLLREWGLIEVSRGKRATARSPRSGDQEGSSNGS